MKKGLILEGGAMRGMFTAGVLDIFMENGVDFDGMIGVSAGAVFGCNFKSRQIGRTIRYNSRFCKDPRYCSFRSLIKTGDLYGHEFCYHEIPEKLDIFDIDTFAKNPIAFYVVCTDVNTGRPIYHRIRHINDTEMEWMRASASMPMVSTPVKIGKYTLLDGGITDSIPVSAMESLGYDRNVVILTQPEGYRKNQSRAFPAMKLLLRGMPKIAKAMKERPTRYNKTLDKIKQKEYNGELFVIRPPHPLSVGHTERDPEKLIETYQIGRDVGLQVLEGVKAYLSEVKR